MKIHIAWLTRYSKEFGGNKFNAFFGLHTFSYGGQTIKSLHFWPIYIGVEY